MVQSPAARRTALLHRMLLVRHLEASLDQPAHDEALTAGVVSALGAGDTLVCPRTGWPLALLFGGRITTAPITTGVLAVELVDAGGGPGVLFCRARQVPPTPPPPAPSVIDSVDVEAIARTAWTGLAAVRGGAPACRFTLRAAAAGDDPVELLAARMRLDHQLDDGTLRAIDRDARAHVAALLQAGTPEVPDDQDRRL
ncbi:hypothetical protein ACPCHT_00080 [Nucisporomicrobium flavum]|uniref:hypothetical protein n=1 Tax=Nucisporomicrobium flavum TaxID=2785915 RepID=UPI0018F287C8|nr:hypothetical protein [Nucisporomicrobium flavum]